MKKLTPAEVWAVHSLEVLAFSACFSFVIQCYQAAQGGSFTLQSTGIAAGSVALAIISKGLSGMISNANTAQALEDVINQVAQSQQAAPAPVQIHNYIPAAPQTPEAPASVQPAINTSIPIPTSTNTVNIPALTLPQRSFTSLETPIVQPTQ